MASAPSSCVGFETRVQHFNFKITPLKDKKRERKFKRMLFSFLEEGKLFIKKSSFEEFNLVFFTAECMVCFEMQPRQRRFCWIFRHILHSMAKRITFLKGNLWNHNCFMYVLNIFSSALKKNYKMRPNLRWILCWICDVLSRFYLRERIHDPDSV